MTILDDALSEVFREDCLPALVPLAASLESFRARPGFTRFLDAAFASRDAGEVLDAWEPLGLSLSDLDCPARAMVEHLEDLFDWYALESDFTRRLLSADEFQLFRMLVLLRDAAGKQATRGDLLCNT